MHFMYFADEVREFGQIPKGADAKVPKREIDLARDLIDKMSAAEFEPEKYHDEYRERFLAMVEQKTKGKEIPSNRQHRATRQGRRYICRTETEP